MSGILAALSAYALYLAGVAVAHPVASGGAAALLTVALAADLAVVVYRGVRVAVFRVLPAYVRAVRAAYRRDLP